MAKIIDMAQWAQNQRMSVFEPEEGVAPTATVVLPPVMPYQVKWEDIEANKTYHIPAAPGVKRQDIWVSFITKNVLGYKEIKNGRIIDSSTTCFLYPNDTELRYIVEKKTF